MEYQAFHAHPWQHGSFWVAVAIVIFAALFWRRIAAPVARLLDARTAGVRLALQEAARLKAEAEAMLAAARAQAEQAAADAKQILATAHEEAARLAADLTAEAEATARRREQMALSRIAAAEKSAIEDVRNSAIDIATAAAGRILGDDHGAYRDTLLENSIAGVPGALRRSA